MERQSFDVSSLRLDYTNSRVLMGLIEKWSTRFAKAWTRLFCFFGLRAIKAREIFPKKLNAQNSWPR